MQQISEFVERILGLYIERPMPIVMIDIIPAGAEAILSGGYSEPNKLQEAIRSLYFEYKHVHKNIGESINRLSKYAGTLPASPEMARCEIESLARAMDNIHEKRKKLEGYTLWLLSQYQPLQKGVLCWHYLGNCNHNRVEVYKRVLVKVSEEFRIYFHELKELVICYWLTFALLNVGLDNENRRWLDIDDVEHALIHQLTLLTCAYYCKKRQGSLNRCFQVLVHATGDEDGNWVGWQDVDKEQMQTAIHLVRCIKGGSNVQGFENILHEIRDLC